MNKNAISDKMAFPNDAEAQFKWIKTATNYLVGHATEMEHFLNWAEQASQN